MRPHWLVSWFTKDKAIIVMRCSILCVGISPYWAFLNIPFPHDNAHALSVLQQRQWIHQKQNLLPLNFFDAVNFYILTSPFWNVCSIRGFTSLLSIIDGKDRMLWNSPTASKSIPLSILAYLFTMLEREGVIIESVRVDEDGALANKTSLFNRKYPFKPLVDMHPFWMGR